MMLKGRAVVLEDIDRLKEQIVSVVEATCGTQGVSSQHVTKKKDNSPVTKLDLDLSMLIKNFFMGHEEYKDWNFYSEEDHDEFKFPAIILDPIDGTRELVKGVGECAVSLALMPSPKLSEGFGWIFNPFTGFEISSAQKFFPPSTSLEKPLNGLVSRSEWSKGYYSDLSTEELKLVPRGSIAFKLGLLAAGSCDFVYSMRPKNIWDIAAGSIILHRRGYKFYLLEGEELESLETKKYPGPMMWAKKDVHQWVIEHLK
jgi:myo-inositol-1(or 4)-monophosphatase